MSRRKIGRFRVWYKENEILKSSILEAASKQHAKAAFEYAAGFKSGKFEVGLIEKA